jgi:hypothetical protein
MAVGNSRCDVILILSWANSRREPNLELRAATATLAGHFDGPPMQLHQVLNDGKTEAKSAVSTAH